MRQLAFAFGIAILLSCGTEAPSSSDISPEALLARSGSGDAPLLLDVRTPEEFAKGHVPGALNIPVDQLTARTQELAAHRDGDVVVYCERGGRAAKAATVLREAGFLNVLHLEGDMSAWRADGRPVDRP